MSLREVTMYRVECDEDGCRAAAPDESGEYFAWGDPGQARDDAVNADWYVADGPDGEVHRCYDHSPVCAEPECTVRLRDAEWGDRCEDHAPDEGTEG